MGRELAGGDADTVVTSRDVVALDDVIRARHTQAMRTGNAFPKDDVAFDGVICATADIDAATGCSDGIIKDLVEIRF